MTAPSHSFRHDAQVIGFVGVAHGASHFFQLALPPLFPLIRAEFGTTYAELGIVMAVYYAVSGIMQTAAGFLVDRLGARNVLVFGLAFASIGTMLYAAAPSYAFLLLAAAIAGLGNSVFHPADLALLNAKVEPTRLGHAFSVHGIGGNVGWALAPTFGVAVSALVGWRGALVAAGVLGLAFLALFAMQSRLRTRAAHAMHAAAPRSFAADVQLLASPAVVLAFLFFLLYAMALIGYQTFGTTALVKIYDVPLVAATTALTTFLLGGAFGVFAGGFVAARTERHALVAAVGLLVSAFCSVLLGAGLVPAALLAVVAAVAGFFLGTTGPSRDILIRGIAPAESRGKVYGFVYSGLDLGGLVAPLVFGLAVDRGAPALVFAGATLLMLLAIPTALQVGRRPRRPAPA
ncbi:MAG: MFS transporter [Burkholderiales bacterium]|jgi:predicted MFS family arabinose efflux permease|nr:MFS transporter [Burkholderiales bacterium]